jgi:two-component system CheB/CheR fusion protein
MAQSSSHNADFQMPKNTDVLSIGYDLVVVGSSAGGIEALSTLVASLPTDFAAALVIAQHLDPDHVSHLGEILARHTTLPVRTVLDQEPLLPGVIYVVPADRDVEISDHEVGLRTHGDHRSAPSVNRLFSSAARAHGERLIGVILTGAGSDGASGARDVKAAGGMVVIENPATAAYASMPQSLAPTSVDLIVDLAQIGPLLGKLVAGAYVPSPVEADTALPNLLAQVRDRTGIDFSTYKSPTILRRLQRRMAITHMETLEAYVQYATAHPDEYQHLSSSLLIKVTEFFRDPELFVTLRDEILPGLIAQARAQGRQLRFWSAGCATGEEAYSLAILLADLLGDDLNQLPLRIFATDVDADAIAFARRGVYPPAALAGLPAELVARAFTPVDGAYEIVPAIRNLVIFGQHDLGVRAPFPNIDLVICRNVLIYFTAELQRRALQLFAFALREGGYLALGKAETPAPFAAYFTPVSPALKLYRRHGARVLVPPPRLTNQPLFISPSPSMRRQPLIASAPPSVGGTATTNDYVGALLLRSGVGVVVVDRHYDIQAINRAAQQLLGIFRAALEEDLIHLVTAELAPPLRATIDAAFANQAPQADVIVSLTVGEPRALQITTIVPSSDSVTTAPEVVLLQISDVTARVQAQQAAEEAARHSRATEVASAPVVRRGSVSLKQRAWEAERQQLQAEITRLATRLDQVTTINHTLRAANDEFADINVTVTGLNEDLVVRNEELQASTEEIKTLNEELQATNEELETLNEEMEATVEELRATNDDLVARTNEVRHLATLSEEQRQISVAKAAELTAILLSMSDALLVVDQAGVAQFTNAAYDALFGDTRSAWVAEDEVGQPLPPHELPQQRMLSGIPFRMVFTQPTPEGERRWLEVTGEPIRRGAAVTGGVLSIRDITDRSLRRLQDEWLALASHELRNPLTAIRMVAQLFARHLAPGDDRMRSLLATMLRQCQQLEHLINDLMDVSRLQHGKLHLMPTPVDLCEIAAQTVATFAVVAPQPPIVLEAAGLLTILGDAIRLEQILTNLLNNASKYAAESPQIVVRVRQVADIAELQVQDSGPGISAAALPQLFQRFYQTSPNADAARTGLGLGLFITQELVVALGGTIQVSSQMGQGTTFTIHFPLLRTPPGTQKH